MHLNADDGDGRDVVALRHRMCAVRFRFLLLREIAEDACEHQGREDAHRNANESSNIRALPFEVI